MLKSQLLQKRKNISRNILQIDWEEPQIFASQTVHREKTTEILILIQKGVSFKWKIAKEIAKNFLKKNLPKIRKENGQKSFFFDLERV